MQEPVCKIINSDDEKEGCVSSMILNTERGGYQQQNFTLCFFIFSSNLFKKDHVLF
jgi:hypothetical protein